MTELNWKPPKNYYDEIASSEVSPLVHWTGRKLIGGVIAARFGLPIVLASQETASTDFSDGNVIVAATHRHLLDTVTFPSAIETVGIHHARPVSKIELFQNPLLRSVLHKLGAFCVDRGNADREGLARAQGGILRRGGAITVYGEGTRVETDVKNVAPLKAGLILTAAANDSTIVPAAVAGLSVEKEGDKSDSKKTVSRDGRYWFGKGPRLVFAFGDPLKVELPYPDVTNIKELSRMQFNEQSMAIRVESVRVQTAMQVVLDWAYKVRGSSLEESI